MRVLNQKSTHLALFMSALLFPPHWMVAVVDVFGNLFLMSSSVKLTSLPSIDSISREKLSSSRLGTVKWFLSNG